MRTQTELTARKSLRLAVLQAGRSKTPLVLLGSHARRTSTPGLSDIDVLMLTDQRIGTRFDPLHVVRLSDAEMAERVQGGDDFAQWALRFGVPLTCQDQWKQLVGQLLEDAPWPNVERKLDQLGRRLAVAEDLLHMGDVDAARDEAGVALNLASRAVLLRAGRFPLSTPELPLQLREIGENDLAWFIEECRSGALETERDVRSAMDLARLKAGDLTDERSRNEGGPDTSM